MHVIYHLPKEFYQVVKRKVKELSPQAKSRQQTLNLYSHLFFNNLNCIMLQKENTVNCCILRFTLENFIAFQ